MLMLKFEKPLYDIREKIEELQEIGNKSERDMTSEIQQFEKAAEDFADELYANLTPSQKIQIARHPERPNFTDFVERISENFIESSAAATAIAIPDTVFIIKRFCANSMEE